MNDITYNIILGVVANVFSFLLGYSTNFILNKINTRSFRRLWSPFLKDKKALVVFSTRKDKRPWNTHRISFTEAEAYEKVHSLCKQIGIKLEIQRSNVDTPFDEELKKKLTSNNLIILGSPAANLICEKVWERLKNTGHPFDFFKERPKEIFTKRNGEEITIEMNKHYFKLDDNIIFLPELNENVPYEDKTWVKDYGIIARYNNPFNDEKRMFLAMGCHGISTYGTIRMITKSKCAKKILEKAKNRDFLMFVKFEISNANIESEQIMFKYDFISREFIDYTRQCDYH